MRWGQVGTDAVKSDSYGMWLVESGGEVELFSAMHQAGPKEPNIQGGTIPLNAWTHVAMTFDSAGGQYLLYVNRQGVATLTSPGAIFGSSHNVMIRREDFYIRPAVNQLIDGLAGCYNGPDRG